MRVYRPIRIIIVTELSNIHYALCTEPDIMFSTVLKVHNIALALKYCHESRREVNLFVWLKN